MAAPHYILHPGSVASRFDGQRHFIDARQLAVLYGVPFYACSIYPITDYRAPPGAVHLYPRDDGDYMLPAS